MAAAALGLTAAAIAARSALPILLGLGSFALLIARDALRSSRRLGSRREGLLVALHHYLAKTPMIAGHLDFYARGWLELPRRPLIEYRGEPTPRPRSPGRSAPARPP
jgi:hypothetical protein